MKIVIYGTEKDMKAFTQNASREHHIISYTSSVQEFFKYPDADAFINLSFKNTEQEVNLLKKLNNTVIINSVVDTLVETDPSFIRINAWPGFFESVIEATCLDEAKKKWTESIFQSLNKSIEWLPDDPGFITARVICMIINEAYFALEEGVSTKEEINVAMKLGTAYPFGPFEWARNIGLKNIVALLTKLGKKKGHYLPAPLLVEEALTSKA